jgi:uncharacterized membrane protein YjgN (DUF898 family)
VRFALTKNNKDVMSDSISVAEGAAYAAPAAPQVHRLKIEFTGSGSEYFRIWIVNLLLLLVTAGIYFPWAKVRRLRYFHGNTLVDGAPLDFHGNPVKMLKGYLLVGVMFALYSAAGSFSTMAGFIALLIVAAVWPALLKSSMQFRLANTSWRGLRFRFNGSLGGAYRAVLPLFVPGLVLVAASVVVTDPQNPPKWFIGMIGVTWLVLLLVMPWLFWNLKRYQHNHYALASQQTSFKATLGSFYGLALKTFGVVILPAFLAGVVAAIAVGVTKAGGGRDGLKALLMFGVFVLTFLMLFFMFVVAKPFVTSRLQNLLWSRTGNASLRFRSDLRFKRLFWLTIKNWLLMIVTLGFYWPFARVALARLQLEAISVETRVHPDTLVSEMAQAEGDAAGDAAGDLFGLDIGL